MFDSFDDCMFFFLKPSFLIFFGLFVFCFSLLCFGRIRLFSLWLIFSRCEIVIAIPLHLS